MAFHSSTRESEAGRSRIEVSFPHVKFETSLGFIRPCFKTINNHKKMCRSLAPSINNFKAPRWLQCGIVLWDVKICVYFSAQQNGGPMAQAEPYIGEQSYFRRKEKHRAKMTFAKFILWSTSTTAVRVESKQLVLLTRYLKILSQYLVWFLCNFHYLSFSES